MQSKRLKSGRCWQKGILVLQGEEEVKLKGNARTQITFPPDHRI